MWEVQTSWLEIVETAPSSLKNTASSPFAVQVGSQVARLPFWTTHFESQIQPLIVLSSAFSKTAEHRTAKNSQASRFILTFTSCTSAKRVATRDSLCKYVNVDASTPRVCFPFQSETLKRKAAS